MLEKARNHAVRCMEHSFAYSKEKWDKLNASPDFEVGELVFVSTTNFNKIKGCKRLKDSLSGHFVMKTLNGENVVKPELSEELSNKTSRFPVRLLKPYKSGDAETFPLRNKVSQKITPVESSDTKKINKVIEERKLRTKKVMEQLVRYSDPAYEVKWLAEKNIPEVTNLFRRFIH
ncbi:hypothetical protein O181_001282 [Austropuccinia psidii MF-1]|uniref:Uncharacterized protein n=1 Tax=Austropuccinia psidii MF-1 TaxID=1389203 RepID=A0A9Q3BAH7_9BASI|nr:hypothetical protein [Austropuccinia psidii MF-1]